MNTSLSWIKAYVPDLDCTAQEYTDAMTLSGSKVEGFERLDENLEKIVVAKVLSIAPHPDADKLIVCQMQVSADGETITFTGLKPGTVVSLYTVAGQLVSTLTASCPTKTAVSVSQIPVGVYVVKANGVTYKITKR